MNTMICMGAALAYGGLAATSQAMARHYADIHGHGKEPGKLLRRLYLGYGWTGILAALAACVGARGWHTGPVLWCGMLTASAVILTLLLHYAPRAAMRTGRLGIAAALLAAVQGWLLA